MPGLLKLIHKLCTQIDITNSYRLLNMSTCLIDHLRYARIFSIRTCKPVLLYLALKNPFNQAKHFSFQAAQEPRLCLCDRFYPSRHLIFLLEVYPIKEMSTVWIRKHGEELERICKEMHKLNLQGMRNRNFLSVSRLRVIILFQRIFFISLIGRYPLFRPSHCNLT